MIKSYLKFFFYLANLILKKNCEFQIWNPDGFHGTSRGRGGKITSLLCHQGMCETLKIKMIFILQAYPPPPQSIKIELFCFMILLDCLTSIFESNPVDLDLLWLGCSGEGGTPERGRWSGCQDPEGREGDPGPGEHPETDEQPERNVQEKLQQSHRV